MTSSQRKAEARRVRVAEENTYLREKNRKFLAAKRDMKAVTKTVFQARLKSDTKDK